MDEKTVVGHYSARRLDETADAIRKSPSSVMFPVSQNPTLDSMIIQLRQRLIPLSDDERLVVFQAITEGYCTFCGRPRDGVCYCTHDE